MLNCLEEFFILNFCSQVRPCAGLVLPTGATESEAKLNTMKLFDTYVSAEWFYEFREKVRKCVHDHAFTFAFCTAMFVITWITIVVSNYATK